MLSIHPLAEIFPPMDGEAFQALVTDIRANGLREPIIIHEGQVLDGRNRYRACVEVGVEPITKAWDQRGDALTFVISKNLHRRHLDEGQRAMVAARIANMQQGARTDITQICGRSQPEAAKLLNVGMRTVQKAKVIIEKAIPELRSAVEAGKVSVSAAEDVATRPKEEQREIMARGEKAISAVAKTMREGRARKRTDGRKDAWPNARRQKRQMESEIWITLRDALIALTSLPLPRDVAAIARANDKGNLVDVRLPQSIEWLEGFANEWRNRSQDSNAA